MSDVITTDQPASATSLLQAKGIANLVERALLTEVRLTPKPVLWIFATPAPIKIWI